MSAPLADQRPSPQPEQTSPTPPRSSSQPSGSLVRSGHRCSFRIAIIGGSLTGPLTALLLLHSGFDDVTVYEAATTAAPRGGGVIGLEHPALNVLDALGIDQDEIVIGHSETIQQITVDHRVPRAQTRLTYPGRSTTWTLLHQALITRIPHQVLQHGHRLRELDRAGRQPVMQFDNGHTECADLIVFADGRGSIGRRLLDPHRTLTYAGYVAHRGLSREPLSTEDFLRFEARPGAQFTIASVPEGADWTFYLNASDHEFAQLFGASPQQRTFVLPHQVTASARAQVDAQAQHYLPPPQASTIEGTSTRMAVPVMDIAPPTQMVWPLDAGQAVLLGDALAPVRPHTAQGANQGIDHAQGLIVALTQHRKYRADLTTALHGWQQRHLPGIRSTLAAGPALGRRLGLGRS